MATGRQVWKRILFVLSRRNFSKNGALWTLTLTRVVVLFYVCPTSEVTRNGVSATPQVIERLSLWQKLETSEKIEREAASVTSID